jgi:hypothetical protein
VHYFFYFFSYFAAVELLKTNGKLQKMWLRVSTTHVHLLESSDSKSPSKSLPLIGVQPERVPPKSPSQHLLELVNTTPKAVILNISDNCNSWLLTILQARVLALKKLYDVCPQFRNFELVQPLLHSKEKKTNREIVDRKTVIGNAGTQESELLKFAFLEYERVGASYSVAQQLHLTYAADVDKILSRLEEALERRDELQKEISSMESDLARSLLLLFFFFFFFFF